MYKPIKKSALFYAKHYQDNYTDLGYDYRSNIFYRTISKAILENPINKAILKRIEYIIVYLIDSVKQIKTYFIISLDKNDRNIN